METFETYMFLHVSAALIWVGGSLLAAVFTERAKKADPAHRLGIAGDLAFASRRVFGPAAMATLVFGVLMVLDADAVDFSDAWISIGLGVIALSMVLGMGYLGPQSRRLVAELEAGEDGTARLGSISRVALVNDAALLVAVWAMVFKPGL